MPPKIKINKDAIVNAAVELVRAGGASALNARTLAAALGCSTQPIFSNFASMDDVRRAVGEAAEATVRDFIRRETESGEFPPYKAGGMGYIRFAKEEKELFKLLFMRDSRDTAIPEQTALFDDMTAIVHQSTGFTDEQSALFHLEMWMYVHGIAVISATNYLDLDRALIARMLTDAYQGLRKQYGLEE